MIKLLEITFILVSYKQDKGSGTANLIFKGTPLGTRQHQGHPARIPHQVLCAGAEVCMHKEVLAVIAAAGQR